MYEKHKIKQSGLGGQKQQTKVSFRFNTIWCLNKHIKVWFDCNQNSFTVTKKELNFVDNLTQSFITNIHTEGT